MHLGETSGRPRRSSGSPSARDQAQGPIYSSSNPWANAQGFVSIYTFTQIPIACHFVPHTAYWWNTLNLILHFNTTIQSFKTQPKRVRDLVDELEALVSVLESLTHTMKIEPDAHLSALKLPIQWYRNTCEDFLQELQKYYQRSGNDRISFRD